MHDALQKLYTYTTTIQRAGSHAFQERPVLNDLPARSSCSVDERVRWHDVSRRDYLAAPVTQQALVTRRGAAITAAAQALYFASACGA